MIRTTSEGALLAELPSDVDLSDWDDGKLSMIAEERTFAELGIPFPLFDAPARFASQYVGAGECVLCGTEDLCFQLGIGDSILENCPRCGTLNALPVDSEATHATCDNCQNLLPVKPEYRNAIVCHPCLRSGKASVTNDTMYGMVRYEDAVAGKPFGYDDVVRVSYFAMSENGSRVKVDPLIEKERASFPVFKDWLFELTRTPTYSAIQGESWEFHCNRPMVYVGEWDKKDFDKHSANGDGKTLFERAVGDSEPGLWDAMWAGKLHDEFAIYMFYCPICASYRGHWDMF